MNLQKMMQQAQMMQEKMQQLQSELDNIFVEGRAGGGMVIVTASCRGEVTDVSIDPSVIKADERDVLEDLIKAAVNDARKQADHQTQEHSRRLMEEIGLPAGAELPF